MIKTFLGVYDIPGDKDRLLEAIELNMEAAVKQQPMPVKVVVVKAEMYKHKITLGCFMPAIFCINKEYQCPMCGEVVREELSYYIDKGQKLNYCPHCGQKLWWE